MGLPTAFRFALRAARALRPREALRPAAMACLPVLAAGLLAGCISDGPNQTGGEYLTDHGILLQNPMYHVKVTGFPVDTFWTTDNASLHVNDTLLLAGRKGAYTAEARFGFQINDTNLIDSLDTSAASLRLSLSTPTWKGIGVWADNGDSALRTLAAAARDSLAFTVLAWDFNDSGLSSDAWDDSNSARDRRFLVLGDTLARLPGPTSIDTVRLAVKNAYAAPSLLQAQDLPRLKETLRAGHGRRHLVQLRLVPVPPADPADTVPAMLRLGGDWPYAGGVLMPSLLFGRDLPADSLGGNNRLPAYDRGNGSRAVAYTLRYAGPRTDLPVPLQRGLHVSLDRARLLDSLDSGLVRQGQPLPRRDSGSLSLRYYVPFAAITLPIDTPRLEAGLPVQVRLITAIDTLLGDTAGAGTSVQSVPLGAKPVFWYTTQEGHPESIVNQVSLAYLEAGEGLRRVVLGFSKDSVLNDTVFVAPGGTAQITSSLSGYGKGNVLTIQLEAGPDTLVARSYLTARPSEEKNAFRDPATGKTVEDLDSLVPRFVRPGADSIRLRATAGIQTLLNRARLGTSARHEFEFRPSFFAFNPKAVNASQDTLAQAVGFPVLSTLTPRIEAGVLKVDLDVYLYPLRAR